MMPQKVKPRYFELIRQGLSCSEVVGVSLSRRTRFVNELDA